MSIFCKTATCPRAKECTVAFKWRLFKMNFPDSNPVEGYSTCVWYIDDRKCIHNNYEDGVFMNSKK